jgi:protoheme IX farnesyltransferase
MGSFRLSLPAIGSIRNRYLPLIKSLQTLLLLTTGLAGFLSVRSAHSHTMLLIGMAGSLFLAISGSTVLNMWYDRDIDAVMKRTCNRPLPVQSITPRQALVLGVALSIAGIGWAAGLSVRFGIIVTLGIFCDVVIYTLWLKRRSPWSIIFGGISGGIPVLAGRALALGHVDGIGILLLLAVLFWIPTHILTFSMKYIEDYQTAAIPTIATRYGFAKTRLLIAVSSILAAVSMGLATYLVGSSSGALSVLVVLGTALLILALTSVFRPSEKLNFRLFKYASLYMLGAMLILAFH